MLQSLPLRRLTALTARGGRIGCAAVGAALPPHRVAATSAAGRWLRPGGWPVAHTSARFFADGGGFSLATALALEAAMWARQRRMWRGACGRLARAPSVVRGVCGRAAPRRVGLRAHVGTRRSDGPEAAATGGLGPVSQCVCEACPRKIVLVFVCVCVCPGLRMGVALAYMLLCGRWAQGARGRGSSWRGGGGPPCGRGRGYVRNWAFGYGQRCTGEAWTDSS